MKKGILISSLILSFLMLLSAHAMAQEGRLQFGNLKIIPGIELQELYDDNIYLGNGTNRTTELEESDWITHIMPALGLNYSLQERGSLFFGYQGDLAYYNDNDKNDWQTHKGILALNYDAPGGLILGIDYVYTDAEDPYGSDSQYKLGVPKTERSLNDGKGKIGYNLGSSFKVLVFYNYFEQDYDLAADYTQDYDINEVGAGFQVRILPKTWGFVRYHYGEQDYFTHRAADNVTETTDADFDWSRVNAGLTWDAGAKLTGELNAGYMWRDFENEKDSTGNKYEDRETWIANTSVTWLATANTSLTLNIYSALRTTGAGSNEYYDDAGGSLTLKQIFFTKFTLSLGGTYSTNDYNLPVPKKREQENRLGTIGLDYQIQDWLSAGVNYTYREKESNYKEDEFNNNQYMISLKAVF